MTEKLLKDPKWRRKNWMCSLLALLPVMGWLGLVCMGRRTGRKQFRLPGVIYAVISMTLLMAVSFSDGYLLPYEIRSGLEFYGYALLALVWLVCLVHTLIRSGQYLKYLALQQSKQPAPHPLTKDKKWRLRNLMWLLWNITPMTGGLSVLYAGCRLNNKKLKMFGIVSEIIACAGTGLIHVSGRLYNEFAGSGTTFETVSWSLIIVAWVYGIFCSLMAREEYLHTTAVDWDAQTRRHPNLLNVKWRLRNSAWQIWTLFPVVGPLGISFAGAVSGRKKYSVSGVVLCLFAALLLVTDVGWLDYARDLGMKSIYISLIQGFLDYSLIGLYIVVFFLGTAIHWDVLKARAARLQGYASEFDRELDMQKRIEKRRRNADVPERTPEIAVAESVETTPVVSAAPEIGTRKADIVQAVAGVQEAVDRININTCTQQELMQLPGVGVAQAKQAMEYRAGSGFKSIDEFVDVLKIKPHFAVQIFKRAVVEQATGTSGDTVPESGATSRIFDF